jgi:DNA gyrase/topoisomerase IV subunit B
MQIENQLDLRSSVRKRPGMYFGSPNSLGLGHLICEVASNPIDLFLQDQVSTIKIQLDNDRLIVEDDGPGFPFEALGPDGVTPFVEYHCTYAHHSPSAVGQVPHVHMTHLNGVGLAAVAAACQELRIQSWRDGRLWEQRFIQGQSAGDAQIVGQAEGSGSIVSVTFDKVLFNQAIPPIERFRQICLETVHLFPGLTIHFGTEQFYSEHGLLDLAKLEYPFANRIKPFYFKAICGAVELQAVALGKQRHHRTIYRAWVNGTQMVDNGTHVDAFVNALKQVQYQPQAIYVHAIMHDPKFAGPTTTRLEVPHLQAEIEVSLFRALTEWQQARQLRSRAKPKGFGAAK